MADDKNEKRIKELQEKLGKLREKHGLAPSKETEPVERELAELLWGPDPDKVP